MKKLVLSVLAVFAGLIMSANPCNGKSQEELAKEYLEGMGVKIYKLECSYSTSNLSVFIDPVARCYIVLADKKFRAALKGDLVLAYSTESSLNGGSDTFIYDIVKRYDAQLEKTSLPLLRHLRFLSKRRAPKDYIAPMDRKFNQGYPFNKLFPMDNGERLVVGCGPLALAQVIYAFGYPSSPNGQGSITDTRGKVTYYNLSNFSFTFDGSEDDIAKVMLCATASLGGEAINGGTETRTTFSNMKSTLVSKWGFTPASTHVKGGDEHEFAAMLKEELHKGRPVLVAQSGDHTFVCDGLADDFVHLDIGWNGYCNGWFRLLLVKETGAQRLPFNEMMVGLEPFTGAARDGLSVTTSAAGTLETLLTQEQILKSYSIKVSGPINGTDIKLLRNMAGAKVEGRSGHGILSEIDLSDAVIVGNEPYHTRPCYNMSVSGRYSDGEQFYYEMDKITDAEWKKYCAAGKQRNSSRYIFKGDDGMYYITFFSENDIIGKYMFDECENLVSVKLPTSAVEMRSYVFLNCRQLKNVENLPSKCDPNALKGSGMENK